MSSDEKNDTTRATPANDAALVANDVNVDEMVSHLTERVHEISTRDDDDERNKEGDDDDDDDAKKVDLQSDNSNTAKNEEEETTNFEEEEEQKKDVGDSKRTIFIGGIPPYEIDEERVTRFFKNEHEEEVTTKLIPDLRKGCHKGYGFVKFKTQESAERFLERGKVEIDGKTIDVKAANKDSPRYDPNHVNSHNNNNNNVMMMMMNAGGNGFYNNNHQYQRGVGGGFTQQGYPNQMMMGGGGGGGRGFMGGGGRGDFGGFHGGRGGRGGRHANHYGQTHGYHQPNIVMGPDGNMMVVDPYFNPNNMGTGGVGANQGMFGQPRPRRFSGGRGGGFMGQRRGTYPAQFNQSGNVNGLNGDGVNGPSQSDGNDGIVNNPDEEDSDDANGNAKNVAAIGGNNETIPLLDENGFPLPAEEQGSEQDRGVGGASPSTSSRRYNNNNNNMGGMGGGYPQYSSQVFVGGLPKTATEEEVGWFFSQYGPVARVRLIYDKETGASKRYGFVEFAHPEIAAAVKDLRNLQFQNRTIDVNYASRHISQMSYGMPPRGSRHHQHQQQAMMQQMMAAGGMPPQFDAMGNPIMYAPNGMMIPPPHFAAMQQQNEGGLIGGENMKSGDDGNTSISNIGGVDMSSLNANMNAGGMSGGASLDGKEYPNMYGAPYGMGFPPGNAAMFGQPGMMGPDGMDPSGMIPIPQHHGQQQQQDFSQPLPPTGMSESVVPDE